VRALVFFQVTRLRASKITAYNIALERLFARVRALVCYQATRSRRSLVAARNVALVRLFARVRALVCCQVSRIRASIIATRNVALERLFARVRALMSLQMLFRFECLFAARYITRKAFIGVAPRTLLSSRCSVHFTKKTTLKI
jgi:hypothetical protein